MCYINVVWTLIIIIIINQIALIKYYNLVIYENKLN